MLKRYNPALFRPEYIELSIDSQHHCYLHGVAAPAVIPNHKGELTSRTPERDHYLRGYLETVRPSRDELTLYVPLWMYLVVGDIWPLETRYLKPERFDPRWETACWGSFLSDEWRRRWSWSPPGCWRVELQPRGYASLALSLTRLKDDGAAFSHGAIH